MRFVAVFFGFLALLFSGAAIFGSEQLKPGAQADEFAERKREVDQARHTEILE